MKSIGMSDNLHKRLRILSIILDKKMWELIELATTMIEEKYQENIDRFHENGMNNHESN